MKKLKGCLLALMLCVSLSACTPTAQSETFTSTQKGYGGDVVVTLTMEGDKITKVEITGESETEAIGKKAIEELPILF